MKKIGKLLGLLLIFFIIGLFCFSRNEKKEELQPIKKKITGNSQWTLTQFGTNEGSQMMSFTIEGNKNGLVIVDGGYRNEEEQNQFLMDKITKHNNIVDAWIVTHFDADHGGGFVKIAQEEKEVTIKNVYVPDAPTDMELLKENAPYEDDWTIYEEFLQMDVPQKVKVHPGDEFEFINLKMRVLCSYEDWINQKSSNLLNNGSMVFKIYGNKESILFCGDIQSKIVGDYLIRNYAKELKSEYLQVAHHGNNALGDRFYQVVSPKIAFFCAPDWLMENRGNVSWYTVGKNREVLEKLGAEILWHNTSPNIVMFQ